MENGLAASAGRAVLAVESDTDRARAIEAAAAAEPGNLVLFDQAAKPRPHPLHDLIAASGDRRVVETGLAFEHNAEVLGLLEASKQFGRFEQSLGRNATEVQARPADLGLLDEGHAHPQLRGPERGCVTAGAPAPGRSGRNRCWSLQPCGRPRGAVGQRPRPAS